MIQIVARFSAGIYSGIIARRLIEGLIEPDKSKENTYKENCN